MHIRWVQLGRVDLIELLSRGRAFCDRSDTFIDFVDELFVTRYGFLLTITLLKHRLIEKLSIRRSLLKNN